MRLVPIEDSRAAISTGLGMNCDLLKTGNCSTTHLQRDDSPGSWGNMQAEPSWIMYVRKLAAQLSHKEVQLIESWI